MFPGGLSLILEFGFDGFVIMGVGAGGAFSKDLALGDLADEQHMAAQIDLFLYLTAKHYVE